ncbi:MAG: ribonuclease H-like domain-containing protein [Fimbriimonadales bacterium]|nr:ribonuclease H-like domain-containing protein [Fimbriimonadales bacterium]MDW8051066.1 ribonuclease H-like domain-containing protein [Armatimonadota bacterium]
MLTRTYIHIPEITEPIERELWLQGATDWYTLLQTPKKWRIGELYLSAVLQGAKTSIEAFEEGDYAYFARRLPLREHWRAYEEFRHETAYLDVETDEDQRITVIGVYDGVEVYHFVRGDNLEEFPEFIQEFAMLVTFNGLSFDIPLIQRTFPELVLDQFHLDLCPTLRRLGLRGGLKRIEQQLGLIRDPDLEGLSGREAVLLWRAYRLGHNAALETLLRYNREDVVNLKPLAGLAYKRLREKTLALRPIG